MKKINGLSFYRRRKKINSSHVKEFFSWLFGGLAAIFIAMVLNLFFGTTTEVVGVSMEPTLYNGQTIFINTFIYVLSTPKEGDVVVFLPNGNEKAHYYVKRVIGLPGETIEIKDNNIYIDGEMLEEKYETTEIEDMGYLTEEMVLEYFVLGDDRGNSEDSRHAEVGNVKRMYIYGKAWFVISGENIGFVK